MEEISLVIESQTRWALGVFKGSVTWQMNSVQNVVPLPAAGESVLQEA